MDKVVNCLYNTPGLSTAMATLMTSITQHKILYGAEDKTFNFELKDIMVSLKSHQIKLSHNLNPNDNKVNIASFTEVDMPGDEEIGDEDETANIAAFNGNRPKCEICFRPHSVKYCPYRGKEFWPPSIKKIANQYNLKHNEFATKIPPRDPRPPPQNTQDNKDGNGSKKKKPLIGKEDKTTINNVITDYLQEDSRKEVSNRYSVSISSLATKYLDE